mmetsp:Transcript_1884/g.5314  ORF Transcript_1884/g.5314 Transcript_1884/m.5314 type:complete len:246 (-) Transcript_1884:635-1372(-)
MRLRGSGRWGTRAWPANEAEATGTPAHSRRAKILFVKYCCLFLYEGKMPLCSHFGCGCLLRLWGGPSPPLRLHAFGLLLDPAPQRAHHRGELFLLARERVDLRHQGQGAVDRCRGHMTMRSDGGGGSGARFLQLVRSIRRILLPVVCSRGSGLLSFVQLVHLRLESLDAGFFGLRLQLEVNALRLQVSQLLGALDSRVLDEERQLLHPRVERLDLLLLVARQVLQPLPLIQHSVVLFTKQVLSSV